MRQLVFQEFITLDGYAADVNGTTSFFDAEDHGADEDLLETMKGFDLILLGAETYKLFVQFWPQATNEEQMVAETLNGIPKIVFSNTLRSAPWGKWPAAEVISGDAVEEIRKLKSGPGGKMVLWGSISLAQALIKANLIDEYHIRIVPILLGDGRLLFDKGTDLKLELIKSKHYSSGLLLAEYRILP